MQITMTPAHKPKTRDTREIEELNESKDHEGAAASTFGATAIQSKEKMSDLPSLGYYIREDVLAWYAEEDDLAWGDAWPEEYDAYYADDSAYYANAPSNNPQQMPRHLPQGPAGYEAALALPDLQGQAKN